jgi:hypothetical protein
MIQFFLHEFVIRWEELLVIKRHYENVGIKNPGAIVMPEDFIPLNSLALQLKWHCTKLEIPKSTDRLWRFENRLMSGVCTNSIIMAELQEIHNLISYEMDDNYLAFIPKNKTVYFEKDGDSALFGPDVYEAFESARKEIKSAGNCLAADEYSAAVFHLLRIVEIGLRDLARELHIKKVKQSTPLDYAQWKEVVNEIAIILEKKLPAAKGPKKTAALQFKHDTLADFKSFDVIRNEIMHCRWSCNEQEALGLFVRVREFMQRLAKNVFLTPAKKRSNTKKFLNEMAKRQKKENQK